MNDFNVGLRKLMWVRRFKKLFGWLSWPVAQLERKEAALISKYQLF